MNYNSTEVISKRYFTRIWINKTNLLPTRRLMYSKRLESGKEAIDIYDFKLTINNPGIDGYNPSQFFIAQISKQPEPETLKPGDFAPKFSATDVRTGKPISLAALKNKVVVLDFWYLSCMPCRELMSKMERLHNQFKGKAVAIIGINFTDTSPKQINKYLKSKQITYQQYYKAQQAKLDFKVYAAPTTMVIGKDGKIKWIEVGMAEDTESHLAQAIKTELAINIKQHNY
ncbi:TlpA family protein disulfide reductase [Mucilaginibacter antarcticus]